jgi:hypothetical protein
MRTTWRRKKLNPQKSFEDYRKGVQRRLFNSSEFREMTVIALKIGLDNGGLAKVAASLIVVGYRKGETEQEVTDGIINGLHGALQVFTQLATEDGTIH